MNCTKCNGSGSEGFISFLRCGRCGGTGQEPADALIPYSEELIVVPDGPVLTQRERAKAKKAEQALSEEAESVRRAAEIEEPVGPVGPTRMPGPPAGANGPGGRSAPYPRPPGNDSYITYGNQGGYNNGGSQSITNPQEKKEEKETFPLSQFSEINASMGTINTVTFSLTKFGKDYYTDDIFLHQLHVDCNLKYIVEAHHQGSMFLEGFFTGIGERAKIDALKLYGIQDLILKLTPTDNGIQNGRDNIVVTLWLERVARNRIHMPPYGYENPRNPYSVR